MPPGHVESNSRGLSLFADYSESFHHKAQVPQTPKITPSLRKFYNPKLSEEQMENQVKSVHELKLCPEQIKIIEKSTVLQSNSIDWKVFKQVELQHLMFMKYSTLIKIIQQKV